ncbi:hypothetical protein Taro_047997 [Colocasia esculenta]|uniref:Uncharacterized protein n=1 Tax=Colocasia esculenta TaxID=4460 RepID=A0A843WWZ1_COLES|nr:hypothetical protein [Colocasia esculenta]
MEEVFEEEHPLHAWVNTTTSVELEFDSHDRAWAEGELDDVPLLLEFETPPAPKRQKKIVGARHSIHLGQSAAPTRITRFSVRPLLLFKLPRSWKESSALPNRELQDAILQERPEAEDRENTRERVPTEEIAFAWSPRHLSLRIAEKDPNRETGLMLFPDVEAACSATRLDMPGKGFLPVPRRMKSPAVLSPF